MTKRVSFFIDGFNLYHSIKQFHPDCRWLNLRTLCERFLRDDEKIECIYYFTAIAFWNPTKAEKHKLYIKALRINDVDTVYGKFKSVTRHCNTCQKSYPTHEEKRTDVNIAMGLFECAMKDMYDKAIIISGDSDLIPPIEKIQENFPTKNVGVIAPVGRKTKELKEVADFFIKMTSKDLKESLLPKSITIGSETLNAPEDWTF